MDLSRPAPPRPLRRDPFVPAVVAASLLIHVAAVAPFMWSPDAEAARPPAETAVEVVQLPPEPAKPPAPKQAEPKRAEPKQSEAKHDEAKQAETKPAPPKPPVPKAAEKPPEPKAAGAKASDKPAQRNVAQRMEQLIGPMPAMALPSLSAGDNPLDDSVSYRQLVLSRVAAQKREGRHDGIPGHVVVSFAIGDGGEVLNCEVREKSVDPKLDAEALAMVRRAAPYPVPPPGAERRFTFGLRFAVL